MLKWNDIITFTKNGNPSPDRRVVKTDGEWREQLTAEEYRITRQKGTERAFSHESCNLFEPGIYRCICCDTLLFNTTEKFDSGTGWPSFTQPIQTNAIAYNSDGTHGMSRVETVCNTCDAHLGHVFPDGPAPSGLRYCINGVALKKQKTEADSQTSLETATFGGGCFWCTEAIFQQVQGVEKVESGYSGGKKLNPSYHEVCSGTTGHAEAVQIAFNPDEISYRDMLRIHLSTHDPTTLNRQGADTGAQYRSVIFTHDDEQKKIAQEVVEELSDSFDNKIVTEVAAFEKFYKAEDKHQNYYRDNSNQGYCQAVIDPKLEKFRKLFKEKMKVERMKAAV